MGCCQSNTSGDDNALPPDPLRASTQSDAQLTSSNSNGDSNQSTHSNARRVTNLSKSAKRPNKPIRNPSPTRNSPQDVSWGSGAWTQAQLAEERTAFFDTRVTGRPEVWTGLKLVCELLQNGNVTDAQGILDALNLTCPSGRVASGRGRDRVKGGVYDERGELYELPPWVVTDPEDTIRSHAGALDNRDGPNEKPSDEDDLRSSSEQAERDLNREQKGKGRAADIGEQIMLRLRLSDRGTDVVVAAGMKEPVLAIVKRVREQIGRKRVRLVYLGHALQENRTLLAQGFVVGNVVNAYVFDGPEEMLKTGTVK